MTGTNGKTTTTTLLAAALSRLGPPALRITTLGALLDDEPLAVEATYDGFVSAMRRARQGNAKRAAIELTSEALALGFAKAWPISIGVFTNLGRDHFDAHGSAEHYLASKAQLFVHLPEGGIAILHGKDPASALLAEIVPKHARILWYGFGPSPHVPDAPLFVEGTYARVAWDGTRIGLARPLFENGLPEELHIRAIGEVFAEDALAALAAALAAGVPAKEAADAIALAAPPEGRFQVIGEGPRAVVDYAHSPDAIARTLDAARALCEGRLSIVFGAGGDRDAGKRPAMGRAARRADRIILTSDNPRSESALAIAEAIREGASDHPDVSIVLDRREAITRALDGAGRGDVVVLAGRGPEQEQIFSTGKIRLSDADVAAEVLR